MAVGSGNQANLQIGVALKVTQSDINKQIKTIEDNIKNKIKLGVQLDVKQNELNKQIQTITEKSTKDFKLNVKINDSIGYINKQISDLSSKITKELSIKLKIDASDLNVITERIKRVQQQAQQTTIKPANISNVSNISNVTSGNNTNNVAQATTQATQAMNVYANAVNSVIQKYKMKKIADEDFIKSANGIMAHSKFQTLSDQKQLQVLQQLTVAERNYNNQIGDRKQIRGTGYAEATAINSQMDRDKNNVSAQAYKQVEDSLRRIYNLKIKILEADGRGSTNVAGQYRSDLTAEGQRYAQSRLALSNSQIQNDTRSNALTQVRLQLQNQLNVAVARQGDLSVTNQQRENAAVGRFNNSSTALQDRINLLSSRVGISPANVQNIAALQTRLTALNTTFAQLGTSTPQYRNQLAGLNQDYRRINTDVVALNRSGYDMGTMLLQGIKKMAIWSIAATAFYAPIRGIQYMVKSLKDMEDALVSIARVMEDANFKMGDFGNSMLNLAKNTGSTFKTTADVALRFAQAGYDMNETLSLTKTALMAVQTAELDATKSTESMIGIMSQWQLSAADMPLLLDKINKISDEYTVTSEDLVQGLLRSSSAAKNLGISLDETISLLTIMRETSGRTGKEVGSALNSILSYATRGKTIDVLESAGIEVFSDKNKTQFRNFMNVFEDISKSWGTLSTDIQDGFVKSAEQAQLFNSELADTVGLQQEWSDVQRKDVSNSAAGTYRRNFFISLIENFGKTKQVLEDLNGAQGYTLGEMDKNLDKISTKWNQFLDTIQSKIFNIGEAGATGGLKVFLDVLIFGAENAGTAILLLSSIIIAFTTKGIASLITAIGTAVVGMTTLTTVTNGATVAMSGLQKGTLIFAAIAAAFTIGKAIFDRFNETTEETKQKIESLNTEIEKLDAKSSNVRSLTDEFKKLNDNKLNLSTEELEKFNKIQNELVKQMPNIVASYDAEGNARIENIETIQKEIDALKELKIAKGKSQITSYAKLIQNDQKTIDEFDKTQDEYNKYQQMTPKDIRDTQGGVYSDAQANEIKQEWLNKTQVKLNQSGEGYRSAKESKNENLKNILERVDAYSKLEGVEKRVAELAGQNIAKNQFGKIDVKNVDDYAKALESMSNNLNASKIEENWIAHDKLVKSYESGKTPIEEFNKLHAILSKDLIDIGLSYEQVDEILEHPKGINNYINTMKTINLSMDELIKKQEELDKIFKESVDSLQILKDAQDEISTSHTLSAKTIASLMDKYPELLKYKDDEVMQSKILKQATEEELQTVKDNFSAKLDVNYKWIQTLVKDGTLSNDIIRKAYDKDLDNFTTVAKLKAETNQKLLDLLGDQWTQYYSSEDIALQQFLNQAEAEDTNKNKMTQSFMSDPFGANKNKPYPGMFTPKINAEKFTPENVASVKAMLSVNKAIADAKAKINSNIDWDGLTNGKDKKGSSSSQAADKEISEKLLLKNRYAELNVEKRKYNALLAESEAIEENADPQGKIKQIERQIALNKQLQDVTHRTAVETRQERLDLMKDMQTQGFEFSGKEKIVNIDNMTNQIKELGKAWNKATTQEQKDILHSQAEILRQRIAEEQRSLDDSLVVNSASALDAKLKDVNAHRNDKNKTTYNKIKAEYDNMVEAFTRFYNIQVDDLPKAKEEWNKYFGEIEKGYKAIKEVNDESAKLIQDAAKEKLDTLKKAEDTIVDMLKEKYEEKRKGEEEALDKSLDNYKEYVDGVIKQIDRKKESENYADDITDIDAKILEKKKTRNEISAAVLSGDLEAINRTSELDKEIKELEKDKSRKTRDKGYDLQKQALQDTVDIQEKTTNNKKDVIKNKYEGTKDTKGLLDPDSLQLEAEKLLTGPLLKVKTAITELYDATGKSATTAGKAMKNDLLAILEQLQQTSKNVDKLKSNASDTISSVRTQLESKGYDLQYNSTTRDVTATKNGVTTNIPAGTFTNTNGSLMANPSQVSASLLNGEKTAEVKLFLADYLRKFGFTVSWNAATSEITINKDNITKVIPKDTFPIENGRTMATRTDLKSLLTKMGYTIPVGFQTGGVNTQPGLYPLHGTPSAPEVIFNATDAKKLFDFVKSSSFITDQVKLITSRANIVPNISKSTDININFGNLLTIQGNVDTSVLPKLQSLVESASNLVVSKIKNELYKSGLGKR